MSESNRLSQKYRGEAEKLRVVTGFGLTRSSVGRENTTFQNRPVHGIVHETGVKRRHSVHFL